MVSLRFCLFLSHCCGFVVIPILSLLTQESRREWVAIRTGAVRKRTDLQVFTGGASMGAIRLSHGSLDPWCLTVTGFRYVFLEVKRRELAGVWIASWKVWIATFRQFRPQAVLRSGAGSEVPWSAEGILLLGACSTTEPNVQESTNHTGHHCSPIILAKSRGGVSI